MKLSVIWCVGFGGLLTFFYLFCLDKMQSKGTELMNTRMTFAWAVAGRFLDRINKINRIEKGARV